MRVLEYSHNNAQSLLDRRLASDLIQVLSFLQIQYYQGVTKNLRVGILDELEKLGWSDKIEIDKTTHLTITSYNNKHGLCLQTGNMSRFYADLLKLQFLYQKRKIKGAFYLIPSKETARQIGSNIAHFDRLTKELEIFKVTITVPILVIGLD